MDYMEYTVEVAISNEEVIEIIIDGEVDMVDNSFSHAFGTESVCDVEVFDMSYDKSEFDEETIKIIDTELESENAYDRAETWFIENYEE